MNLDHPSTSPSIRYSVQEAKDAFTVHTMQHGCQFGECDHRIRLWRHYVDLADNWGTPEVETVRDDQE